VGDFHENILERRSPLAQFAQRPVALGGKAENLFAYVDA
jgi:hypothetical protein